MAKHAPLQQQALQAVPAPKPVEQEWPYAGEVKAIAIVRRGSATKLVAFVLDGGIVAREEVVKEDILPVLLGASEAALLDNEIQEGRG